MWFFCLGSLFYAFGYGDQNLFTQSAGEGGRVLADQDVSSLSVAPERAGNDDLRKLKIGRVSDAFRVDTDLV